MRRLVLCVTLLITVPSIGETQARPRPFAELSVGVFSGFGGDYQERVRPSVLVSVGTQPHADRAFVLAAHTGFLGWQFGDDICVVPPGRCRQYPVAGVLALSAGSQMSSGQIELTAGPGVFWKPEASGTSLGLLVNLRLGGAPGHYLAPGIGVQGVVVSVDGEALAGVRGGLSIRFW